MFARIHPALIVRAEAQARGTPERPGSLTFVSALLRLTAIDNVRGRLFEAEPDNTVFARDLSVSYNKLGDLAQVRGQGERAEQLHRDGLQIAQRLAEPDNTVFARGLSVSYERLGELARIRGEAAMASSWIGLLDPCEVWPDWLEDWLHND